MKIISFLVFVFFIVCSFSIDSISQFRFFTRNGEVSFYSKAPLEDIKAVNKQLSCIYDIRENRIIAKVLIKAFKFDKALMQEHFNENYLESDKYPKAVFKGKINNGLQNIGKDNWKQTATIEGKLSIHGITKNIKLKANLIYRENQLFVKSSFNINIKDYEIEIPSTVINNISENIKISVNFKMSELKK